MSAPNSTPIVDLTTRTKVILASALFTIGVLGYTYYAQYQEIKFRQTTAEMLQTKLATTEEKLVIANKIIENLRLDLTLTHNTLTETEAVLLAEQNRNEEFSNQIEKITGTVAILDKLAKTDKELLRKYSKIYFLNEHYQPARLREIADDWKYSEDKSQQLHSQVLPFFEKMVKAAKKDKVDLWVVSAFRSFDTQTQLKSSYQITYGSGANSFSADQGYSEHQLGTTIDFTTKNMNGELTATFENTDAYQWLVDNAYKYGFTLSYPRNNTYYIYEPWHWRFVGISLARDLKNDKAYFYDWDQRKIDEYLVEIFN